MCIAVDKFERRRAPRMVPTQEIAQNLNRCIPVKTLRREPMFKTTQQTKTNIIIVAVKRVEIKKSHLQRCERARCALCAAQRCRASTKKLQYRAKPRKSIDRIQIDCLKRATRLKSHWNRSKDFRKILIFIIMNGQLKSKSI